jgi:hypothetical protein
MNLPNAEHAIVDERKVREHLLSRSHPIGRFKAAALARAGFDEANWAEFISALLDLARRGETVPGEAGEHGQKYLVSGTLRAAGGAGLEVWTVWILSRPDARPRLVTVYPR